MLGRIVGSRFSFKDFWEKVFFIVNFKRYFGFVVFKSLLVIRFDI